MKARKILVTSGIVLLAIVMIVLLTISVRSYINRLNNPQNPGSGIEIPEPTPGIVDRTPPLDEEAREAIRQSQLESAPSVYLYDFVPFESETFIVDVYYDNGRQDYVYTIQPKTFSLQEVQAQVNDWLLGTGLSQEAIDRLYIEYIQ